MSDLDGIKKSIDQIGSTWHQINEHMERSDAEVKQHGEALAETKQTLDRINEDLGKALELKDRIERAETAIRRSKEHNPELSLNTDVAEYKTALRKYLRTGNAADVEAKANAEGMMAYPEFKALSVDSDPNGGYLVTPDTSGRIIKRIFETSPMRAYAAVQVISTDALEGIYDDDEAGAGRAGERQSRSNTGTPKVGQWRIPVHEYYAAPLATKKFVDDAAVDVEAWIEGKVARKLARLENEDFVDGDGVNGATGILSYANASSADTYERGALGTYTADAATISFEDLINVQILLKSEYKPNARWFANRRTYGALRLLRIDQGGGAGTGEFLWQPSMVAGQPSTLLGDPIVHFEDMPDVGSEQIPVLYGSMEDTYQIVDRQGIRVLVDPFSQKPYIEYYTTKRTGGQVVGFDALKRLEMPE